MDRSFLVYPLWQRIWPFRGPRPPDLVAKTQELYPHFNNDDARRFLQSLNMTDPEKLLELERRQAKADHKPSLEELLEILVEQALVVQPRSGNDLSIFMRLLGLAFSQSQGHLRRYLEDMYGKVFRRYMTLVNEAAPRIPPIELFWRVHFMLGAAAFSMSGIKALRAIAETDFGVNTSIEQVMRLMVPFLAAGMRADTGVSDPAMIAAQLRPRTKSSTSTPAVAKA
ncbi:TetR family transcriptional regulator [Pseudomonas syringae]|uniref:TetR family transcriptional regulator n=1 Tax=Pseudomonas syringae TaxID=317 RepID=UPI001F231666|nr:TetR family transcriptional regulator [Pseudomonas syringae]